MREILFRGKDNKEWIFGELFSFVNLVGDFYYAIKPPKYGFSEMRIIDKETVGQYTGLTDENGKKIFEGDIIKYNNLDGEQIKEVTFKNYSFYIGSYRMSRFKDREIEVIGNIYDNPELMEKL